MPVSDRKPENWLLRQVIDAADLGVELGHTSMVDKKASSSRREPPYSAVVL